MPGNVTYNPSSAQCDLSSCASITFDTGLEFNATGAGNAFMPYNNDILTNTGSTAVLDLTNLGSFALANADSSFTFQALDNFDDESSYYTLTSIGPNEEAIYVYLVGFVDGVDNVSNAASIVFNGTGSPSFNISSTLSAVPVVPEVG